MILRDGHILLEFIEVVNSNCLSKPAFDKAVQQGRIVMAQRGGNGSPALLEWASLPDTYKELVRAHLGGDPEQLAGAQVIEQHLELVPEDEAYLSSYRASNGLQLATKQRQELMLASRIMAMLATADKVMKEGGSRAVTLHYGMPVMELKQAVLQYVMANRKRLPVKFPSSFPRMEARKRAYLQCRAEGMPGATSLIHGSTGNNNRSKLTTEEQQQVMRLVAARPQNHSTRRIARDYNVLAARQGWPAVSADTVRRFLADGVNGRTVAVYAKGKAAYHDTYGIVVHRSAPSQPTLLWVHDATDYELLFQREVAGKRTYHHRKKVCVVLDPHTQYPVGYAIGEEDTIELTKEAFRDAVRHMRELHGTYAIPHQVQSDRMGWKALGEWYAGMGITYTPAAPRNARAKVIEPWFRLHNDQFVNAYSNWSGHNITSRKENQPNPDALNLNRKSFPNEASVIEQIHESMARHRATKVEAYRAALANMPEGRLRTIDRAGYLEQFGTVHPWTNELTNRGLCPTLLGEERTYQLLDNTFQGFVGASFQLVFDPTDLRDVLALAREGSVRYLVPAFDTVPMALADHTAETRERLADLQRFKLDMSKEAINQVLNDKESIHRLADALLADAMPRLRKAGRSNGDDLVKLTPEEEVVTKNYLTEGGSHKAALRTASKPAQQAFDPERWAEDQL